jgi:hypothetical protein
MSRVPTEYSPDSRDRYSLARRFGVAAQTGRSAFGGDARRGGRVWSVVVLVHEVRSGPSFDDSGGEQQSAEEDGRHDEFASHAGWASRPRPIVIPRLPVVRTAAALAVERVPPWVSLSSGAPDADGGAIRRITNDGRDGAGHMASARDDRTPGRVAAVGARWSRSRRASAYGVLALSASKAADLATTVVGLSLRTGFREANPLIAPVIASVGVVPGLLAAASVTVAVVALVTEGGVVALRRGSASPRHLATVRLFGYGLPTAVSLAAAAHNASLLTAG